MRSHSIRLTCSSILLSASLLTACGGSSSSSAPNSGDYITHAAASLSAEQALAHYLLIQEVRDELLFSPGLVFNLSPLVADPDDDTRCLSGGAQSTQLLDSEPEGWVGAPLTHTQHHWQGCHANLIDADTGLGIDLRLNGSATFGIDMNSPQDAALDFGGPGQAMELWADEVQPSLLFKLHTRLNGRLLLNDGTRVQASLSSMLTADLHDLNTPAENRVPENSLYQLSVSGYRNEPMAVFETEVDGGPMTSARARVGYRAYTQGGSADSACALDGYVDVIGSFTSAQAPQLPQGDATFYLPSGDISVYQLATGFEVKFPQTTMLIDEDTLAAAEAIAKACHRPYFF